MKKEIADGALGWHGFASSKLVDFMKEKCGITISENAECFFEYEDKTTQQQFKELTSTGRGERSQFDFFISDSENETQIYFEIKYTESDFGRWAPGESIESTRNHGIYLGKGYKPLIEHSPFLTSTCKKKILTEVEYTNPDNEFNRFYQLLRNALRADEKNKYTIFIFPAANLGVKKEFELFETCLTSCHDHIIPLLWENLSDYMTDEFYEKYISFLK